jgi:hypothetical protein
LEGVEGEMRTVAALYVDRLGPYPKLEGVDCWDESRDARLYDGPHPVVAHPPCGPWGAFAHLCRDQDPGCALRAVEQVRLLGGVLEHPKGSRLWRRLHLPEPSGLPDQYRGHTVEVNQCAWGHVCSKPTWLYFTRISARTVFETIRTGGTPIRDMTGYRGRNSTRRRALPEASQEQRRRTPPLFAEWLVSLARSVQ